MEFTRFGRSAAETEEKTDFGFPCDLFDCLAALGLALVTAGLFLVYPPAALIVPGLAIAALGIGGAAARAAKKGVEGR